MTQNLSYPSVFTALGFLVNSLIDKGEHISEEEMYKHIKNKTVWTLLEQKSTNSCLSLYPETLRNEMMDFFACSADVIDAERKYGVVNNGYCLLIAYLFEAVQSGKESGWFASLTSK